MDNNLIDLAMRKKYSLNLDWILSEIYVERPHRGTAASGVYKRIDGSELKAVLTQDEYLEAFPLKNGDQVRFNSTIVQQDKTMYGTVVQVNETTQTATVSIHQNIVIPLSKLKR